MDNTALTVDARFWDGIAERYAAKPIENVPAYERKLEFTRARLHPTDVVLDVGCGTGSLALTLSEHVSHVHGLDVSSEMVGIAKRKADRARIRNTTFHHGTVETRTFAPNTFDVVCAYNILHLVEDLRGTVQTLARLLKPGGSLVASTVCLGESWLPYGALIGAMRWFGKAPRVFIFDKAELVAELERAGLVDIEQHDVGAKKTTHFALATKPA